MDYRKYKIDCIVLKEITFIIVNYNSSEYLRKCISSIVDIYSSEVSIIIVNNSPEDSTLRYFLKQFSQAIYIENAQNIGFGAANNLASEIVESEFICLLNPDTILLEDIVNPILEFMDSRTQIGACSPMLLFENGEYQSSTGFRFGVCFEIAESTFLMELYRYFWKKKYLKYNNTKLPFKVAWVSAACLIVRTSDFREVNGFSSEFFLNYEDIELCKKLEDYGKSNYYFPYLNCLHYANKSFGDNYELLVYSRYLSKFNYSQKYYNKLQKSITYTISIMGLAFRIVISSILKNSISKSRIVGYKKALKLYLNV